MSVAPLNGPIQRPRALLTIYPVSQRSATFIPPRLFPSRGIAVSIKLNQFMTRLRGRVRTHASPFFTHPSVRANSRARDLILYRAPSLDT